MFFSLGARKALVTLATVTVMLVAATGEWLFSPPAPAEASMVTLHDHLGWIECCVTLEVPIGQGIKVTYERCFPLRPWAPDTTQANKAVVR